MSRELSEINSRRQAGLSIVVVIEEADLILRWEKFKGVRGRPGPGLTSTSPARSNRRTKGKVDLHGRGLKGVREGIRRRVQGKESRE